MSIAGSIEGWPHCRPVISVDGTALKSKYLGTLLTACCLDGNNQIFPLAFGIVDSENDSSWQWFMTELRRAIGHRDELVIISDRNISIPKAVLKIFPDAEHGFCVQHLLGNLKTRFKDPAISFLFNECSRAYTKASFAYYMNHLESISTDMCTYLHEIGYEKWARSYFSRRRYNIMTTNISESFNNVCEEARDLPVASTLENITQILQRWFYERRTEAARTTSILTKWADSLLQDHIDQSRAMNVSIFYAY